MLQNEAKVLVIILNYKTPQLTLNLVDSLKNINYHSFDIMVIDNNSPDNSGEVLQQFAPEKGYLFYKNNVNSGYAAGNNIGIRYGIEHGYDYSWILNSDVVLMDLDVLKVMVYRAELDPQIGVVGPLIVSKDGEKIGPYLHRPTFWRSTFGIFADKSKRMKNVYTSSRVYRVYGCCMLLRNDAMKQCECMDERTFLYCEEDILAERLLKYGYYAYYEPSTKVKHNESSSMRTLTLEQIKRKDRAISKSRNLYFREYLKYNTFEIQLIHWVKWCIFLYKKFK